MSTTATKPSRKFIDCREMPSDSNCSLKISGTEDEVVRAAAAPTTSMYGTFLQLRVADLAVHALVPSVDFDAQPGCAELRRDLVARTRRGGRRSG